MTQQKLYDAHTDYIAKSTSLDFQILTYKEQLLKENHVIDENQSVKWNREECQRRNQQKRESIQDIRKQLQDLTNHFHQQVYQYIQEEYDFNKDQAVAIYNYAYEESHSYGFYDVINTVHKIASFLQEFAKIKA